MGDIVIPPTSVLDRMFLDAAKALLERGELSKENFEKIRKGIEARKKDNFELKDFEVNFTGS